MCGIVGFYNLCGPRCLEFKQELEQAVVSLNHRGPDDAGIWWDETQSVGLGHTRLAILDLSPTGHQPMVSRDGRFTLVFNGEVYNFHAIRRDLETKGHSFQSRSDTEVVLHAFREWGLDCVHRFIGMFAFAIWDNEKKSLFLCRDRVGVKPLYYGWDGKVFWFGSELKALRAFHHWSPKINRQALGEFLQYGYIAAPRTIYRQIYKLLPGHWLEVGLDCPQPRLHRYWSLREVVARGPLEGTEEALADELEALLVDAFRYRMIADVPVGVFLSGGIDSTTVAAVLQKHSSQPIHTFTIGFKERSYDESDWARKIAHHLGTEHTAPSIS